MNSQKRATAKPKPSKRGGHPNSLSRLGSLLPTLSASRGRFANSSLLRLHPPHLLQPPHLRQYFESPHQKQRARTTFSVNVKLQEPPKPPVDIIQIPSPSKEYQIPSNITLEMLEDIYSYEFLLELDEIDNLKKNAKEIAEEIIKQDEIDNLEKDAKKKAEEIKQDNFDKTIIRKIEECKEKVRLMLWNKFYTTFKMNAKTLTGGNGDQNAYNAWYNDDEKSSKPIVVKWGFRLSIFSFVYRVLEYCINLLSKKTASTKPRRYDQQYYIDKMELIRKKTLKDLMKSGIDSTKIEKIVSNFRLVEKEKKTEVLESLKVRDELERIAISELYNEFPPDIRSSSEYNNLYQPFTRIKYLKLYGSTLPYQFNRTELLRNMLYVLERVNIKNFIDLHDCEGITNISDCNPYDLSGERDMFDLAVKVMNTRGRKYINVKGYVDMRSGSYSAWLEISKIPDTSVYETLVHCYMGRGRTGSVLLFLLLRDFTGINRYIDNLENRLGKPHLGYDNIYEIRNVIIKLFDENDIVDNVFVELFNVEDMKHIRLLRQRLNRIFFFLAKKHNISHVCLYQHIPSYPEIIEKIKRRLRRENPQWSEEKIELETNYIYGKFPSDDAIISYEFSKTKIYKMSSFDSMYPARIESILDGE